MIEFKSLLEALEYHPVCPLCQRVMTLDCKAWALGEGGYLSFDFGMSNDLRIEIASQKIAWVPNSKSGPYTSFGLPTKGLLLNIDCSQCSGFGYTLFLKVDMRTIKIIEMSLNSETIRLIDELNNLHEVESVYDIYSKYSQFPLHSREQGIKIPLIHINIDNPQETIDRARTLATFS